MAPITLESQAQPLVRQLKVITQVINDTNINFGGLLQRNPLFVSKFVDGELMMSLSPDYYKRYHDEIPRGYPTILQMVDEYKGPIEPKRVDLILLMGCINDVGCWSNIKTSR